jgi:hypothetical protein
MCENLPLGSLDVVHICITVKLSGTKLAHQARAADARGIS